MTKDGVLILQGNRFRDQQRNRADVRARLIDLIARAAVRPKTRRPTKPSRAAKEKRLQDKKVRSQMKRTRGKIVEDRFAKKSCNRMCAASPSGTKLRN